LRTESYSVENLKYEATLEVDRDEIADDQTGQIRMRIGELAQRAASHKDYLLSQLMINGATSGYNSYDGVTFFNSAHASGASGSQSNDLTFGASAGNNVPDSAEFRAALQQAVTQMLGFKDDQGEPIPLDASGLVCVVPAAMLFSAMEVVNATLIESTTNVLHGAARVIAMPWLTSVNVWYLLKVNGVVRPFIFQDREPIEFGSLSEESEDGFKREKLLFGVRARYRMTYGYWQHAVRTTFT
jgi:phage major head subunit gpT-like protein